MRLVVKRWGNGLAVRLPKERPEYGRLIEGMTVEVDIRAKVPKKGWKFPTFDDPVHPDLSTRHDDMMADDWQERMKKWPSSTRVS